MVRVKVRRRVMPEPPSEFVYAEQSEGGRWVAKGLALSEAQFLADWEPLGDFEPYVPPPRTDPLAALEARLLGFADRQLLALINLANRLRRHTASEPETFAPRPGIALETVLPSVPQVPAQVAGEVIVE